MVVRRVWGGTSVDLLGTSVSADGRYLTFIDWAGDDEVMIRDLLTGHVERVTYDRGRKPWSGPVEVQISPDGSRVAYLWFNGEADPEDALEVRVIRRGEKEAQIVYRGTNFEYPELWGWLPDGSGVLFLAYKDDGSHRLMTVAEASDSARTLMNFGPTGPSYGAIAPDGSHIAYAWPQDRAENLDVFVLDLGTGSMTPLIESPAHDYPLGWAPDGRHLLFASDRSGILGAWLQPLEEARADGDPEMVKADLWRATPVGFTEEGSFFFGIPLSTRKVFLADLDPETWHIQDLPTGVSEDRLVWEASPDWSPDGRYLAYETFEDSPERAFLVIRDVETGRSRTLTPDRAEPHGSLLFYPDSRNLLLDAEDEEGRQGWFRVDRDTGTADPVPVLEGLGPAGLIDFSPDGTKLLVVLFEGGSPHQIASVDMEDGEQTVLVEGFIGFFASLSPDGTSLAFAAEAPVGSGDSVSTPALMVMPARGGSPRTVFQYEKEDSLKVRPIRGIAWSRDGESLVYGIVGGDHAGLWRVPAGGGDPQRIEYPLGETGDLEDLSAVRIHPDGRRIAFINQEGGAEVWVMEGFLPGDSLPGMSR
jgi:Tol biopolymer transport system component